MLREEMGVSDELNLVSVRPPRSVNLTSSSSDFQSDSPKNDLISKSKKKILVKRRTGSGRIEMNVKSKRSKAHQQQVFKVSCGLFLLCWLIIVTWLIFSIKEREQSDQSAVKLEHESHENQSEHIKALESRVIVLEKKIGDLEGAQSDLRKELNSSLLASNATIPKTSTAQSLASNQTVAPKRRRKREQF